MATHAIDMMVTQLGVQEDTGNNDGIPSERYMRGDKLAWCAGICLWSNDESDDPDVARNNKEYYKMRNVQSFEDTMKERGVWIGRNIKPRRNDFIFFGDRGDSDAPGKFSKGRHMGIVEKVDKTHIYTVEGNTGNKVARRKYPIGHARITGFARVVDLEFEPDTEWGGVPFAV